MQRLYHWAWLLLCLLTLSLSVQAEDDEFSWNLTFELGFVSDPTLMIGAQQSSSDDYLNLDIWLDLYYKGFFIQSNRYRSSGYFGATELGYELHVDEDYEISLINKNYLAGFNQNNVGFVSERFIPELAGVRERRFVPSQGVRYVRYLDDAVLWTDVAVDLLVGDHKGWVVDSFYVKRIEYRNLDISLGAGITLFSGDMTDYFFGVDLHEVAENRPQYNAGFGYRAELEAAARYPLSQNWLLSAGTTLSHYSSSIANSPLVERDTVLRFKLSISYVF